MATVLLAISDPALRLACRRQLAGAGHAAVEIDRPLSLLSLAQRVGWDALCVDDSDLGRSVLSVAQEASSDAMIISLGFHPGGAVRPVRLPLRADEFLASMNAAPPPQSVPETPLLRLDPAGHRALVGDTEIRLSSTEYRLLALLFDRRPHDVRIDELLRGLWGQSAGPTDANALRVHILNLRSRLAGAGLRDVVQSRRGRGYALVLP